MHKCAITKFGVLMIDEKKCYEVFTTKADCDYCDRKKQTIMYAVIRPIYKWKEDQMRVAGINTAKKCMKCCEEEQDE
jgi:hypothetical protein